MPLVYCGFRGLGTTRRVVLDEQLPRLDLQSLGIWELSVGSCPFGVSIKSSSDQRFPTSLLPTGDCLHKESESSRSETGLLTSLQRAQTQMKQNEHERQCRFWHRQRNGPQQWQRLVVVLVVTLVNSRCIRGRVEMTKRLGSRRHGDGTRCTCFP